jgi:penicillin amidase
MRRSPWLVFLALSSFACSGSNAPPPSDAGLDAPDTGPDCAHDPLADGCLPAEPTYAGPSAPIEVIRDAMGIPHLYAATDADAYYASGYMQAVDRLFEMDLTRRRAHGRRAEVLGESAYDDDVRIRTFDLPHWADLSRRQMLVEHPDEYALIVAWCAGVNARIAEIRAGTAPTPYGFGPAELNYLPEPFTVLDAQAVGTLILFGNAEQISYDGLATVIHRFLPELETLLPILAPVEPAHTIPPDERLPGAHDAPSVIAPSARPPMPADLGERVRELLRTYRAFPVGASNNWVVSGAHTANGRPLLAGDPHQGLQSPSLMWTHHMNSAEHGGTLDVIGFSFVGTPSIELGHNAHIAWGATTTYPDWMDLWGVTASTDAMGNETISYGGQTLPVVHRVESFMVRGEAMPRTVTMRDVPSVSGMLLPNSLFPLPLYPGRQILLRWVGFAPSSDAIAFHLFDVATSTADFEAAVDVGHLASFNWVAADQHGITYRSSPWVPIRAGAPSPTRLPYTVLDGDDVGSLWTGNTLPISMLPHSHGGARGWIATANNEPYGFLDGGSILDDPFYFGVFFDPGTRAQRIEDELTRRIAAAPLTRDDMVAIQDDTYLLFADDLVPPLVDAWSSRMTDPALASFVGRADLDALVSSLATWDRRMERSSPDAVVFNALMFFLAHEVLSDDLGLVFDPILDESPTYIMKLLTMVVRDHSANGDAFFQEGRHVAFVRAIDAVASYLTAQFGTTDRTAYSWGMIHGTQFDGIWGPRLDGGWWPTDGSLGTINVSDANFFDGSGMPRTRLEAGGGSIYRLAVQFAADGTPEAVVNIPRGVSGEPDSPHFADLQADWQTSTSRPLAFRRADVEAAASERLTIPAR